MVQATSDSGRRLPGWLMLLGSLAIAGHFFIVLTGALATPSGPWPLPDGPGWAEPPRFAQEASESTAPAYAMGLHLDPHYRPSSNRPSVPGVYFEVRLKNEAGEPIANLRFPDPEANVWIRYRQGLLANALAPDRRLPPPAGESIPAPGQEVRMVPIWEMVKPQFLELKGVPEHLIPRDHPVFAPSEWTLLLIRSYVRHLCRVHGAAKAELIRHTREPVPPGALSADRAPPGAFEELVANYGEFPRE